MGMSANDRLAVAHASGQSNEPMSKPAHALSIQQVIDELGANTFDGLSEIEASVRHQKYGKNDLGEAEGAQPIKIIIAQIANAMTLVLILAMAVSYGIKSYIEGGVITFVILVNVVVGFFQEWSAEKTMDSLRALSSPTATVVRDGDSKAIPSDQIVPGDLVEIMTGDTIPADLRLIEAVNFETDEALLTGESLPVRKNEDAVFDDATGPGDRLNVAYSSSTVTKGCAKGVVFATGSFTEIGAIASTLQKKDSRVRPVKRKPNGSARPHRYLEAFTLTLTDAIGRFLGVNVGTPLQKKLSKLAILLFGIAVVCAIIVLAANKFDSRQEVIIYAVATGLSMIPASLVVVLTITMAAGTKRMVQRNVIVRNLRSLEALGAVTDICSDKTGTLTQGKMVARGAWVPCKGTCTIDNSSSPIDPTAGDIRFDPRQPREINFGQGGDACGTVASVKELLSQSTSALADFLHVASLANLATVAQKDGEWRARGDPTKIAIQVFASREVAELPFDSDVKRMSVIMKKSSSGKLFAFTKGAVERVIGSCSTYCPNDSNDAVPLTEEFQQDVLQNMEAFAGMGLRVLALASKPYHLELKKGDEVNRASVERDLVFRGLIGLYDPPRPESAPAVQECHKAGITVHMLTGDHPETAKAIAREVGILPSRMDMVSPDIARAMIMTAARFDALSDEQVRMVEALHRRKKFCAMTGDGVNDSPSLRRADVGIAMGQSGSDVAKDASDIVLTDDNFASIVAAIEEGRRIFDNIQKFVLHVLAENIAQAVTLLVGLAFKDSSGLSVFPLTPVEIVWIIMATSGLPDMGLGFERAVPGILDRPPQSLKAGIFTLECFVDMVVYGLWIAALCLGSFLSSTVFRARATTFACLTWFALFLAWKMVDKRRSFFRMQPGSDGYLTQWIYDVWRNQFLFWAVMLGFVTLSPVLYIPVINTKVFRHKGISWEWGIVFVAAGLFFAGVEAWKWCKRLFYRRQLRKQQGVGRKDTDIEKRIFGAYLDLSAGDDSARDGAETPRQ
ncbi:cation transporting ATPase [Trichoderma compactum]